MQQKINIIDVSGPGWKWITFIGAVGHAVPAELANDIVVDITSRTKEHVDSAQQLKKLFIDLPGPYAIDQPTRVYKLDGLDIDMPSGDVSSFLITMRTLKKRISSSGVGYYKLHGYGRCIVLLEKQFFELKQKLVESEDEANAEANAFFTNLTSKLK